SAPRNHGIQQHRKRCGDIVWTGQRRPKRQRYFVEAIGGTALVNACDAGVDRHLRRKRGLTCPWANRHGRYLLKRAEDLSAESSRRSDHRRSAEATSK